MQTTPNHYRDYLKSKYGYEVLEDEGGFLCYRIIDRELNIGEIYVALEYRTRGVATRLADAATAMGKELGCQWLSCQTEIVGKQDELSMLVILHYGFKPIKAQNNMITFYKEII